MVTLNRYNAFSLPARFLCSVLVNVKCTSQEYRCSANWINSNSIWVYRTCVPLLQWSSVTLFLVELPSPSVPTLTFHNLTTVIISWQYGSHDPQNGSHDPTCFLVEYTNNTSPSNVSSLICDNTTYVFPWLQSGQRYKFRIYSTANDSWSAPGPWSDLFTDGFDGE